MPFTKFSNLDFDQIRESIKDYLRANSTFTDFDFEGSNFSVLIDTLAYNTYITAFNSNMVVNESFLDSATLRENVVSLARNIGYVPRSRTAAKASVSFNVQTTTTSPTLTLQAGLVCIGSANDTSYVFSVPENVTTTVKDGVATFGTATDPLSVYQGTFLSKQFVVDGSLDQRFLLDNSFIDSSTIVVYVKGLSDTGLGREYSRIDNILNVKSTSETYLIQEVQDEKYELLFGDGIFGKKLEDGTIITATYIITDGKEGNGPSTFSFSGSLRGSSDEIVVPTTTPTITTVSAASNGGDIESVDSIKYFAPRLYSAQYRAVTGRDYETIIQSIYPNTESVSVVGGEELDPPQFGTVFITIKPKNGEFVSDFDKQQILSKLKNYSLTGINQKILELKLLYVEMDSFVYYNSAKVTNVADLKTNIVSGLETYADSKDINKFGGRFKYSKVLSVIDNIDSAITSNITKIMIRRNLKALTNQLAQYELCYGNKFHVNPAGGNIKSTGFTISGESSTVYFTDTPNITQGGVDITNSTAAANVFTSRTTGAGIAVKTGVLSIIKIDAGGQRSIVARDVGTVDYEKGEIIIGTINITSTVKPNNIIEIQAFPESNDIIGLKDLYLNFDISNSSINMVKDTITSGEQISGVGFKVTSSYTNGELTRG